MDAGEYQKAAHKTSSTSDVEVYVLGLIGEAGAIASIVKQAKRQDDVASIFVRRLGEELGDLLWYASEIATTYDLKLGDILAANLKKVEALHAHRDIEFDTSTIPDERFPQSGTFLFKESGGKLVLTLNGSPVGAELDDNAHIEDGYRLHDVFHIVNMVLLGWSPVMRKLLGCKRRKGHLETTDNVEDGARAMFLEEGLVALIFSQSEDVDGVSLFTNPDNIPFHLATMVKRMVHGLEVEARPIHVWRHAISVGFQLFDELRRGNGGEIIFNIPEKSIEFRRCP